jgi:hypothetical protein
MHAFYALYAFHALVKSVSYGLIEGWKVQVPSPASSFVSNTYSEYLFNILIHVYD